MTSPIIEIDNLVTIICEQIIHQDLSLTIQPQSITVIVGDSGCGKTTLLREMIGLLKPKSGSLKVLGIDLLHADSEAMQTIRTRIGVMFQQGALYSALTVAENIAFPLKKFTQLKSQMLLELAEQKAWMCGLAADALSRYPAELSGGMLKRAAVARAIALDPEILFLDEPTAGLDPNGAAEMDELIRSLRDHLGLTVIMVTHDLDTMYDISDRVIYLSNKKVLAEGPVRSLASSESYPELAKYFRGVRGRRYLNYDLTR